MNGTNFDVAIKNNIREIKQYAEINFTDEVEFDKTYLDTYSRMLEISVFKQIFDKKKNKINYATFEQDFFATDGSFFLPYENYENKEVGFITKNTFQNTSQEYFFDIFTNTLSNNIHLEEITIIFDGGYPISGRLDVLYWNNSALDEIFFENNDKFTMNFILETAKLHPNYTIRNVSLIIFEYSNPKRRVRINSFYSGLLGFYDEDDLYEIAINEEVDELNMEAPSNEMTITIFDTEQKYNILETNGLVSYIKNNIKMTSYIGCVLEDGTVEYENMGNFYLVDWKNNQNLTTTFIGRNLFETLPDICGYRTGLANITNQMYFTSLLSYLGITKYIFNCDIVYLNDNFMPFMSAIEQLQFLALISNANIYVDVNDNICMVKNNNVPKNIYPLSTNYDNPQVEINNRIRTINAKTYQIQSRTGTDEIVYRELITADSSGITTVRVSFNGYYDYNTSSGQEPIVVSNGTIIKSNFNYVCAEIVVSSFSNFTLTITMQKMEVNEKTYTFISDVENGDEITFEGCEDFNYGVVTFNNLNQIVNNIFSKNKKYRLITNSIGDPRLRAGNIYTFETYYGNLDTFVSKQNIIAGGYLKSNIEGEA